MRSFAFQERYRYLDESLENQLTSFIPGLPSPFLFEVIWKTRKISQFIDVKVSEK